MISKNAAILFIYVYIIYIYIVYWRFWILWSVYFIFQKGIKCFNSGTRYFVSISIGPPESASVWANPETFEATEEAESQNEGDLDGTIDPQQDWCKNKAELQGYSNSREMFRILMVYVTKNGGLIFFTIVQR